MMSQGSKNSAGRSSDAAGPESMLLFPRPGGMSLSKLAAMSESSDSATGATSSTVTAPQPGLIPIRPSLLNPRLPHSTANQATVARGTGASQNGAGNSAASPLNSQSVKKEQTGTDVLNVKQQFDQLQLVNQSLANTKEKTPMCLINELARFNKVQHQYTLVDEQGPAHKKTFFVKLKLGEEEYSAEGASIKKAQHAAASAALDNTKLKHPPPKPARFSTDVSTGNNLTPTVELNALAMKRGEPAVYKPVEAKQPPYYPPPNFDFRGMYNQRYHYPRMPRMFYTSLKVGPRMFFGDGPTRQAARHVAANKALKMLRYLPLPNQSAAKNADAELDDGDDIDEKDQLKSEISLVHEIALKNNVEVVFEVIRESGPPHMKLFVTQCRVGDLVTEAQGNSKKLSKKKAAEEMLDKLQDMRAAASASQKTKPKLVTNKKKSRNLIKVDPDAAQKADVSYGVGINPISRLIQIMQAQKKKEPLYSLLTERGLPRRREFVMQVCVDDKTCTGVGPNKKLAKRCAAEAMLQLLGFSQPTPQPTKPALKSPCSEMSPGDKKVTFCDADDTAVNGQSRRQLMPGLLFLRPGKHRSNGDGSGITAGGDNCLLSSIILKNSDTRPEQQLLSVVEANNIKIDFDDFSGKECLCRVTLSSHPNDSVHGTGTTRETARDAAALQALRLLASTGTVVLPPATGEGDATGSNQGAKVHTNDGGKPVALEST